MGLPALVLYRVITSEFYASTMILMFTIIPDEIDFMALMDYTGDKKTAYWSVQDPMIWGNTSAEARRLETLFPYLTARTVAEKTSVTGSREADHRFSGKTVKQATVEKRANRIKHEYLSDPSINMKRLFHINYGLCATSISVEELAMLDSGESMIRNPDQGSIKKNKDSERDGIDKGKGSKQVSINFEWITTVHTDLERLIKERAKIPVTTL